MRHTAAEKYEIIRLVEGSGSACAAHAAGAAGESVDVLCVVSPLHTAGPGRS